MPVFSHFRFTDLGQRAITKVNGVVAQIGVWYNQGSSVTSQKANNAHLGELYDQIKYEATNGTLTSNVGVIDINFPPNKTIPPTSSDAIVTMNNNQVLDLINHIAYNSAVDRIKIISYTNNVGELEFYGATVYNNKVIMQYDFTELKFTSTTGVGSPYQKIYFKVGNKDGFSATTYSVTINIIGTAELINLIQSADEVVDLGDGNGYKGTEMTLRIKKGYINGIAKFKMNVNLSANAWPVNTQNTAMITYNGGNEEVNANGDTIVNIPIGSTGETDIIFGIGINLVDLPVTGTITFTLIDINGNTALVSSNNVQVLNINY
jgi:hypothetical protein